MALDPQARPVLPIVLPGGVKPSGKKSWMKGYTFRISEDEALAVASAQADAEGTGAYRRMAESAAYQLTEDRSWLKRPEGVVSARPAPKVDPYEGFVPTPKGAKARMTPPPYDVMRRVFDSMQGVQP